jgi:hypothetical protein
MKSDTRHFSLITCLRRMKHKNRRMLLFFLIPFSFCIAAAEENGRNTYPENKFADRFSSSSLRDGSGVGNTGGETGGIDLDDPTEHTEYALNPIGDALSLFLTFGLAYGFYVFAEKEKQRK